MVLCFGVIGEENVFCRLHDACVTSEVFTSHKCDCSLQLHAAMRFLQEHGGLLIYSPQEGRGAGVLNKIAAYAWQTCDGFDTVRSDRLVCASDERREYAFVTTILRSMHVQSIRLLTNSASKLEKVRGLGVRCTQAQLPFVVPWRRSIPYLECKNSQMGHAIEMHALSMEAMQCLDHVRARLDRVRARPKIVLSFAASLNGVFCAHDGAPLHISNAETWRLTHYVRSICDHILVGSNTVRNDNPRLDCRTCVDRNPKRVVLTSDPGKLSEHAAVFRDDNFVVMTSAVPTQGQGGARRNLEHFDGSVEDCLSKLSARNCRVLMVEGGEDVLRQFLPHSHLVIWTQRLAMLDGRRLQLVSSAFADHKLFQFGDNSVMCCSPPSNQGVRSNL